MNRVNRILFFWCALCLLAAMLAAVRSAVPPQIEWHFHGAPIYSVTVAGETLELGCRSDGVVVWRKILAQTNSPAEATEIWATNLFIHGTLTNIPLSIPYGGTFTPNAGKTRSPGWVPPPQLPNGTNRMYPTNLEQFTSP